MNASANALNIPGQGKWPGILMTLTGWITVTAGMLVIASWQLGIVGWTILVSGGATMKANTALGFLLCGIALLLLREPTSGMRRILARICLLPVLILSLLTLLEYATGWDLRIDELIARDSPAASPNMGGPPGRMSVIVLMCLLPASFALLLMSLHRKNRTLFVVMAALGAFMLSLALHSALEYLNGINFAAFPWPYWHPVSCIGILLTSVLGLAIMASAWIGSGQRIAVSRTIIGVYLISVMLTVFVTVVTTRNIVQLLNAEWQTQEKLLRIEQLYRIQNLIDQEEDAHRGYLISGKEAYLDIFKNTRTSYLAECEKARGMVSTNPVDSMALSEINAKVAEWQHVTAQELEEWRSSGARHGSGAFLTEKGQLLRDQIRKLLGEMIERNLLGTAGSAMLLEPSKRWTLAMLPARMILLIIVLSLWLLRINVEMSRRHRLIEAAKRESEQLNNALASGKIGTWEMDLKTRAISRTPIFERLFGPATTSAPWLYRDFLEKIHPMDRPTVDESFQRSIHTGKDWSFECRFTQMNRLTGWIWGQGTVVIDTSGRTVGMQGVIGDMTERYATEESLRMSETRLRMATEAFDIGIWDWDLATNRVRWNPLMFRIYGMTEPDNGLISYKEWRDRVHPEDIAEQEALLQKTIVSGGTNTRTFRIIREGDGAVRTIRASDASIAGPDGRASRVVGVNLDITGSLEKLEAIRTLNEELRKRAGELETAVAELDAFSYSVSHDLRAPLRAVDGFSQILEQDYAPSIDQEGRRLLGVIRTETRRMDRLINDLLTFSRLSRQRIEPEPVDMFAMAREVFDELMRQEKDRNVRLELARIPPAVGTASMIRQVWVNLIGNAIKFSRGREVAEIRIGSEAGEAGETVYFIRDNGAGFDMRYADKLFGVFTRLHSAEEFPGTGVGLALVQRIIRRHKGRVWGEGEVGKGAIFRFTLPSPDMKEPTRRIAAATAASTTTAPS